MKKVVYVTSFTLLGVLVQLLIHALVETWYINLLLQDYQTFGLGMTWQSWEMVHNVSSVILLLLGVAAGLCSGLYWWKQIYVLKRWKKWKK